jgi:hypothetical protein
LIGTQLDALGLPAGSRDLRIHHALGGGFFPHPSLDRLLEEWVGLLVGANDRMQIYAPELFAAQLEQRRQESVARHRVALRAMAAHRRLRWKFSSWASRLFVTDPR